MSEVTVIDWWKEVRREQSVTILKERIFKIDGGIVSARAWVPDCGELSDYFAAMRSAMALRLWHLLDDGVMPITEAAETLCKEFKVNAIEVIDSEGRGAVCYADWP